MTFRALIAEDEPLARQNLRDFLEEVDWLELVGEATDGLQAVETIDRLRPDLIFLDVKMPELSGLEVLERIHHDPAVVFTTAYDRYAVAAFELEALDYLVKPFGRRRFQDALARVRKSLEGTAARAGAGERAREALSRGPVRRLFARHGDRIHPIVVSQVSRFEACDDYIAAHVGEEVHLLNLSLSELEVRLDPEMFRRVHRSHILNLDHIKQMRPYDDRRLLIVLRDGSQVLASRSGSKALRDLVD